MPFPLGPSEKKRQPLLLAARFSVKFAGLQIITLAIVVGAAAVTANYISRSYMVRTRTRSMSNTHKIKVTLNTVKNQHY